MSSGFGVVPSQDGGSSTSGGFNFPWVSTPSLGAHPLGENFHHGEVFPLLTHQVLGVSSLGLTLGMFFLEGPHLPLGETPLGACLVLGEVMLLEVPPSWGNSLFRSSPTLQ
jgi:hypothetical protein